MIISGFVAQLIRGEVRGEVWIQDEAQTMHLLPS